MNTYSNINLITENNLGTYPGYGRPISGNITHIQTNFWDDFFNSISNGTKQAGALFGNFFGGISSGFLDTMGIPVFLGISVGGIILSLSGVLLIYLLIKK